MDNSINDRLEKLWGHLGDMTPDQIRERIREIRNERRVVKMRTTVKKTVKQTSDAAKTKMKKLLVGMTPEEMARMLKDLEP
jgi:hypothetical protein